MVQVTLGMCLVGALPWVRGAFLTVSQVLGGTASAAVVMVLFPGSLNVRTSLLPGTSVPQGLFIEMFLSAQPIFTIFMLAAEKHKSTFIAPVGIGLSLFVAELTGVYYTGGSVNPARSFGPCVVLHSFYHYHWIYWIGPILGAFLASGFYKFIRMLEYEAANPGQDFDDKEQTFLDPSQGTSRPIINFATTEPACAEHGRRNWQPCYENATNGGRAEDTADNHRQLMDDEATASEGQFRMAPDPKAGKARPRSPGRV
ncbi:MAG: hypothetical protein Q9225_003459 [Loekoesia sp. 1 TL-2023]